MTRAPRSPGRLVSRPHPPSPTAGDGAVVGGLHLLDEVGLPDHLLLVPEQQVAPVPLLVWFHGAGGRAASSVATVEPAAAGSGALVLLPSSAGTTWDLLSGRVGRDTAALDIALEHVFSSYDVGPVALAGFSDGASYALSLGLANGDLAEAVLAFSPGFTAPPGTVGRPRCWIAHGTQDAVLPVDRCGRRVASLLTRDGYEVHYEEFAGGHVVRPDHLVASLAWWLRT